MHGLDPSETEAVAASIGEAARPIIGDLREAETCEEIVRETVRAFGRIDGLVNNAGIYPRRRLEEATAETFDLLFHVNTRAPLLSTKAAVAEFQRQGSRGSVVSIGSLNGWSGQPDLTIYSMSKGALMTMTRNLADRFGPERIRFTCLNVGWVATENEKATQISLGMAERWWEKCRPSTRRSAGCRRRRRSRRISASGCRRIRPPPPGNATRSSSFR